jgi:hypothetical protein
MAAKLRYAKDLMMKLTPTFLASLFFSTTVFAADALEQQANLEQQMQRITPASYPAQMHGIGREWAAAIQQLIEQKKIQQGMPVALLIKHMGPPSSTNPASGNQLYTTYHWYFSTPMHTNPVFDAQVDKEIVRSYLLDRR